MEIRIKGDAVEIEGYVNAIERKSKPLLLITVLKFPLIIIYAFY